MKGSSSFSTSSSCTLSFSTSSSALSSSSSSSSTSSSSTSSSSTSSSSTSSGQHKRTGFCTLNPVPRILFLELFELVLCIPELILQLQDPAPKIIGRSQADIRHAGSPNLLHRLQLLRHNAYVCLDASNLRQTMALGG